MLWSFWTWVVVGFVMVVLMLRIGWINLERRRRRVERQRRVESEVLVNLPEKHEFSHSVRFAEECLRRVLRELFGPDTWLTEGTVSVSRITKQDKYRSRMVEFEGSFSPAGRAWQKFRAQCVVGTNLGGMWNTCMVILITDRIRTFDIKLNTDDDGGQTFTVEEVKSDAA